MKRKNIAVFGAILLLVSCGTRKLRSDIDKFITSFSLENAVSNYLYAGYTSTLLEVGPEYNKKEEISLEFDVRDAAHPKYQKETKKYENDVLVSTVVEEIKEDEEGFIFSISGQDDIRYTLEECHDTIKQFFYKVSQFDDAYHTQGMYYGDYLRQVAPGLQDYVTIDEEKGLYIMEYAKDETIQNKVTHIEQKYEVNRLGMLEKNHFFIQAGEESKTQDIAVFLK